MTLMQADHNPLGKLLLPPPFALEPVEGDAFAAAGAAAAAGAGAGLLLLAESADRLDLAVVLEPDRPLPAALVALPLAMLALADALATLGPPQKSVNFVWPDGFLIDGARVGDGRLQVPATPDLATPDSAIPEWLVIGLRLQLRLPESDGEPGGAPERTALLEEGFGDLASAALVELLARNLLYWVHRLAEDGSAVVAGQYRSRLSTPSAESVRIEPQRFELHRLTPPGGRQTLAQALGLDLGDEA